MRVIRAYSDGACDRHTGRMHIGLYAESNDGNVLFCEHKQINNENGEHIPGSCNAAELYAILEIIHQVDTIVSPYTNVILHTDSMLAYKQIKKEWRIKSDTLFYLVERVRRALDKRPGWQIVQIPREQNRIADSLSSEGCPENPRTVGGTVDFSRIKANCNLNTSGINADFMRKFFPIGLPELKRKLLSAIEAQNIEDIIQYADRILYALKSEPIPKTTPYLDRIIKNVVTKIVEDISKIVTYAEKGDFKDADDVANEYEFLPKDDELICDESELNENFNISGIIPEYN